MTDYSRGDDARKYERLVLELICGGDIPRALPWHELRTDRFGREGLWVRLDHGMTHPSERDVVEWSPQGDVAVPALSFPFSTRQLAAFMIDGGGWFLRNIDTDTFSNSASAVAVYTEAERLCEEAEAQFGFDASGTRKAAAWLLTQDESRDPVALASQEAVPPATAKPREMPAPAKETPAERRTRRLSRFRELGGDMRRAGTSWQTTGQRGALASLVKAEMAAGQPMSDKTDVRKDLIAALGDKRGS